MLSKKSQITSKNSVNDCRSASCPFRQCFCQNLQLRHWSQVFCLEQRRKRWKWTSILLIFPKRKSFSFFPLSFFVFLCYCFPFPDLRFPESLEIQNSSTQKCKEFHIETFSITFLSSNRRNGLWNDFRKHTFSVQHSNRKDVICGHRAGKQPYGNKHYILVPQEC